MSAPRTLLRSLFDAALAEVHGHPVTERAVTALELGPGPVFLVGAGKAVCAMAMGAQAALGSALRGGLVVTKDEHALFLEQISVREAAHPLPDARSHHAANETLSVVESLAPEIELVVLLSGGASALWTSPVEGISLADKQQVTGVLLRSGVEIEALNAVRKHLSRIKGGGLVQAAGARRIHTLLLSDVRGDRIDTIASGPTAPDATSFTQAREILLDVAPRASWPEPVLARFDAGAAGRIPDTPSTGSALFQNVEYHVLANLETALTALRSAALAQGLDPRVLSRGLDGEAAVRGRVLAGIATSSDAPELVVAGGEPVVHVTGTGKGGRAQEAALAFALEVEGRQGVTALFAGTDGSDGPTDAAGAIVDGQTARKAREAGQDPAAALRNHDSYTALDAARDLLRTGPTQTNVNDLALVLRSG